MNNDPLSFPSETPHDATTIEALDETTEEALAGSDDDTSNNNDRRRRRALRKQRRNAQNKKRAELLGHLLRSIDIVIYCELSTVYYMELSFSNPTINNPLGPEIIPIIHNIETHITNSERDI